MDPKAMNPIALAFLGDALYEQFIRERLVRAGVGGGHADRLHSAAVRYVCAGSQAKAMAHLNGLAPEESGLSEEEASVARRARNHKIATKPKNADAAEYKSATAFEALLGYLYLSDRKDRCLEIMEKAAVYTEESK